LKLKQIELEHGAREFEYECLTGHFGNGKFNGDRFGGLLAIGNGNLFNAVECRVEIRESKGKTDPRYCTLIFLWRERREMKMK
jgi:hypothetical protein